MIVNCLILIILHKFSLALSSCMPSKQNRSMQGNSSYTVTVTVFFTYREVELYGSFTEHMSATLLQRVALLAGMPS